MDLLQREASGINISAGLLSYPPMSVSGVKYYSALLNHLFTFGETRNPVNAVNKFILGAHRSLTYSNLCLSFA